MVICQNGREFPLTSENEQALHLNAHAFEQIDHTVLWIKTKEVINCKLHGDSNSCWELGWIFSCLVALHPTVPSSEIQQSLKMMGRVTSSQSLCSPALLSALLLLSVVCFEPKSADTETVLKDILWNLCFAFLPFVSLSCPLFHIRESCTSHF